MGLVVPGVCDQCGGEASVFPAIVRYSRERAKLCRPCLPVFAARVNRELAEWMIAVVFSPVSSRDARGALYPGVFEEREGQEEAVKWA